MQGHSRQGHHRIFWIKWSGRKDLNHSQYRIGLPFADAAEMCFPNHDHQFNPIFETAYWRERMEPAKKWRERLGQTREKKWYDVTAHLPPLSTHDGLYVATETTTDTFTAPGRNTGHACMLAPLGILDGNMVDRETMR